MIKNTLNLIIVLVVISCVVYMIIYEIKKKKERNLLSLEILQFHHLYWKRKCNQNLSNGENLTELLFRIKKNISGSLIYYFAGLSEKEVITLNKWLCKKKNIKERYVFENMLYHKSDMSQKLEFNNQFRDKIS